MYHRSTTSSPPGSSCVLRCDNALGTLFHSELELKETIHEDASIHCAEDPEDAFEDIQNDDDGAYAEKRAPYGGEAHVNKSDRRVKTMVKTHNRVVQTDQKQSENHRQVSPLKCTRRKETAGLKLEVHNSQAQKAAPVLIRDKIDYMIKINNNANRPLLTKTLNTR